MKLSVRGTPTTIVVDGQTWPVTFDHWGRFSARMNSKNDPDYARADKFTDLAEAIRTYLKNAELEREANRQERAAKKAKAETVPVVWALYKGEKVAVRGRSAKTTSYRNADKLLITRADGKKETVWEGNLTSLSSDVEALARIDAERDALSTEMTEHKNIGKLEDLNKELRLATLEISYNTLAADFTGTYGDLTVTASTPKAVEDRIVRLAISAQRPFMVEYEKGTHTIVDTVDADSNFYSYDLAWVTREDAERYVELSQREIALDKERRQYRESFNYEEELEIVRTALKVVNGEA